MEARDDNSLSIVLIILSDRKREHIFIIGSCSLRLINTVIIYRTPHLNEIDSFEFARLSLGKIINDRDTSKVLVGHKVVCNL